MTLGAGLCYCSQEKDTDISFAVGPFIVDRIHVVSQQPRSLIVNPELGHLPSE